MIAALAALTLTAGAQPRQLHQPQETQQAQKRYGVKSGILKLTASADGHDTPETQYFDEYGAVVRLLREKGIPTTFESTAGTHFAPLLPRIDQALAGLKCQKKEAKV